MTDTAPTNEYAALTPGELRKEADRRELVERARVLAVRHDARLQLVKALHALDRSMVADACAGNILKEAVLRTIEAEKAEAKITNGEVSMASFGAPENWWREATAAHPKREHPDLLDEIERGRKPAWPGGIER